MKLVFDTNILVSAAMLPDSVPAQALNAAEEKGLVLYSDETLAELVTVLERPKLRPYLDPEMIAEFFVRVRITWQCVPIVQRVLLCRDPKDDKFLELALNGQADFLITGDQDLLVLHPYQDKPVLTPALFLTTIGQV
jgi:uncharacterized protein